MHKCKNQTKMLTSLKPNNNAEGGGEEKVG